MKPVKQLQAEPRHGAITAAFDELDHALADLDTALGVLRDRIEPVLKAEELAPPSMPQTVGQAPLVPISQVAERTNSFARRVRIQISAVLSHTDRVNL